MLYQSPAKVAETIGKNRKWVIALCNENKLPFIRKNGRYLIDADKLEQAFAKMETASSTKSTSLLYQETNIRTSRYRL
jgi:hypothetical protein